MEEEFKLPDKWCIKVLEENREILGKWRSSGPLRSEFNGYWLHTPMKGANGYNCKERDFNYNEITFEQFKKYVLKETIEPKITEKFSKGTYVVFTVYNLQNNAVSKGEIVVIEDFKKDIIFHSNGMRNEIDYEHAGFEWFPTKERAEEFSKQLLGINPKNNFIEGRWYKVKFIKIESDNSYYLKYTKNTHEFGYSEYINLNTKQHSYLDSGNTLDVISTLILVSLEEIQEYLPEGHPDKIIKEESMSIPEYIVVLKENWGYNGHLNYCYKKIEFERNSNTFFYFEKDNCIDLKRIGWREATQLEIGNYPGKPYDITTIKKESKKMYTLEEIKSNGKLLIYIDSEEEFNKLKENGFKLTTEYKGRHCYNENENSFSSSSSKTSIGMYDIGSIILTIDQIELKDSIKEVFIEQKTITKWEGFKIGDKVRIKDTGFRIRGLCSVGDILTIESFKPIVGYDWGIYFTNGAYGGHTTKSISRCMELVKKNKPNYKVGDWVVIVANTNRSCNKIGDVGQITELSKEDGRVQVRGKQSVGNWSLYSEIRPATREEIALVDKRNVTTIEDYKIYPAETTCKVYPTLEVSEPFREDKKNKLKLIKVKVI